MNSAKNFITSIQLTTSEKDILERFTKYVITANDDKNDLEMNYRTIL